MAMNRIQFQPGMSLFELFEHYGTEAQCEAVLERGRWPDGFRCRRCDATEHCVLRTKERTTFQCNACHHQTSLIAGTVFEGTKLALTLWFLAIYLISQANPHQCGGARCSQRSHGGRGNEGRRKLDPVPGLNLPPTPHLSPRPFHLQI